MSPFINGVVPANRRAGIRCASCSAVQPCSKYVPSQLRTAVITPIPRVPKPTQAADYSPISITPVLSRSLEKYGGLCGNQCSRIRIFRFFQISKNAFLRFFEMTYQKVVKSHQQKFSPQYVRHQGVITSLNDQCNSIPSSQKPLHV